MGTALGMLACTVSIPSISGLSNSIRGSGVLSTETRSVRDITAIELAMPGVLWIELGQAESLRIEGEDNLLPYIETEVRAGTLEIRTQSGVSLQSTKPIAFCLSVRGLDSIAITSSGDVHAPDLTAGDFVVEISSSGDLSMGDLQCDRLRVEISSSGEVSVGNLTADRVEVLISSSGGVEIAGGAANVQAITISSSGRNNAPDLESSQVDVCLSSSGSATLRVSDRLIGRLSGSGDINYIGDPRVDVSTSSSGTAVQIKP
jgi:hypothetical protein